MDYAWTNDDLWQVRINETDFDDFEQPYIGNGILGARFGKLVAGTDQKPLYTLSRAVYDGGKQLLLPAWNHIFFEAGGVAYTPESGKHRLEQVLDIRNGVVSMVDRWEYKTGKTVTISVEMFIPRTFGHASYLSFAVENLQEEASLRFGLLGSAMARHFTMSFSGIDDSAVIGEYRTAKQDRPVCQAIRWKSAGLTGISWDAARGDMEVSAALGPGSARLELFHSVKSYAESGDTRRDAVQAVHSLCSLGRDALLYTSAAEWKRLWAHGLAFRNGDFQTEKSLLAHQFYLLCSLESCEYPFGPLGLSKNEWGGNQLWDADFWVFRAILPLWPDFAKSMVRFRKKTLESAREHARVTGYRGAWYAWQTDEEGRNITNARYNDELHVNVWIALAAWEYFVVSGDRQYLSGTAWPIISGIADFFASRVEMGPDGLYHLNCVLGPDESVAECGQLRVNDNFLTNFGVKKLMDLACRGADILGVKPAEEWKTVMEGIYLPSPDLRGIIPEYKGYTEHGIKQSDVILAFYPLGYEAEPGIIRNNVGFYRDKQMQGGPQMSFQIESCILMKAGEKKKGLKRLFDGMGGFVKGKHCMPFECRDYDNSIMLTGIGGELQALIFGFYEAELQDFDKLPRIAQYMEG